MQGHAKIIMGAQFGDEGKGKIIDAIAKDNDIVARYQGGANAGHNVEHGDIKFVAHLFPSAITNPNLTCVIANGVLVDPVVLLKEKYELQSMGVHIDEKNFLVSDRAFITLPHHRFIDYLKDLYDNIGTTGTGMTPTAVSKYDKSGFMMSDLLDANVMKRKLSQQKELIDYLMKFYIIRLEHYFSIPRTSRMLDKKQEFEKNLGEYYDRNKGLDIGRIVERYSGIGKQLGSHLTDTVLYFSRELANGRIVIGESAQGSPLGIDQGMYPFVSVTNPGPDGFISGTGIPWHYIREVIGVVKMVPSKVGEGRFIGEYGNYEDIKDELRLVDREELPAFLGKVAGREYILDELRKKINSDKATDREKSQYFRNITGAEFGATTGRPRRLGMLDLELVRYYAMIHGMTGLALTKLDAYTGIDRFKIITAYNIRDKNPELTYEMMQGWDEDISGIKNIEDLPLNAIKLITRVFQVVGVPPRYISVGPRNNQLIIVPEKYFGKQ